MTQRLLIANPAGMRLIAQTAIYNSGNLERLRVFVQDSYLPALLEAESVEQRVARFQRDFADQGKLKILQVLAHDPHHVIVLTGAQLTGDLILIEVRVEPEFPHRITDYTQREVGSGIVEW